MRVDGWEVTALWQRIIPTIAVKIRYFESCFQQSISDLKGERFASPERFFNITLTNYLIYDGGNCRYYLLSLYYCFYNFGYFF